MHVRARVHLVQAHFAQCTGGGELACEFDAPCERPAILRAFEVVTLDLGGYRRISAGDAHRARRAWPASDHLQGEAVMVVLHALA